MTLARAGWLAFVPVALMATATAAEPCSPDVVKVPCRNMGDGRILIDSLYLPDTFVRGKSRYTIIRTGPTSMSGEWANLVCTLKLD